MNRSWLLVGAIALLALPAAAEQTFSGTRGIGTNGVVEIENAAGAVRVVGWELGEVRYNATLGRGAEDFLVAGSGNRLVLKVVVPRTAHNIKDSDVLVHVPAGVRLEITTIGAHVEIAKFTGAASVETVSGTVTVSGSPREVEVRTVSGFVKVEGVAGPVDVRTVSGDVELAASRGRVSVATVSGSATVRGGAASRVSLHTTSGDVRFEGDVARDAALDAKTLSGLVELVLPAAVGASFDVTTFSGDIRNEFGPPPSRPEVGPGAELAFAAGGGGARVRVNTFSGNVVLRKR